MKRPFRKRLALALAFAVLPWTHAAAQDGAPDIRKQEAEEHFQHGLRMVGLRNNDRAIELFRYAIALDPDHHQAHFYVGLAYIQRGYTSLRLADYHLSRAIALDGQNPRQYHWRGIAQLRLGNYAAATADFEVVLRETPDSPTTLRALGAALLRMGAPGPASAALRQAVDLEPEMLEPRWNLMVAAERAAGDSSSLPERYRLEIPERGAKSPFRFEEVSADIGIERWSRARASGWADFDGDGDLDLFALGIRDPHALYRNRLREDGAATFASAALDAALFDPRGGWSALFFDYDRDGDPDLYVTRDGWDGEDDNSLYRNDGGRFVDVAAAAGILSGADSFTAAVADVNRDGLLDVYVANGVATRGGAANELFLGLPEGRFAERAEAMGVADHGRSIGSAFGDYDNDGWPDLLVVNFFDRPVLYRNLEGGGFEDVTDAAGIAAPHEGFVGFFFDYDNDGWLDLLIVGFTSDMEVALESRIAGKAVAEGSRLALYRNDGDGAFTDVTAKPDSPGISAPWPPPSATTTTTDGSTSSSGSARRPWNGWRRTGCSETSGTAPSPTSACRPGWTTWGKGTARPLPTPTTTATWTSSCPSAAPFPGIASGAASTGIRPRKCRIRTAGFTSCSALRASIPMPSAPRCPSGSPMRRMRPCNCRKLWLVGALE